MSTNVGISLDVNRLIDQGAALINSAKSSVNSERWIGTMELPKRVVPGKRRATFVEKEYAINCRYLGDEILEALRLQDRAGSTVRGTSIVTYQIVTYENLRQGYIENLTARASVRLDSIWPCTVSARVEPQIRLGMNDDTPEGRILFIWDASWGIERRSWEVKFEVNGPKCKAGWRKR